MALDNEMIKKTGIYSAILGAGLAIAALIPMFMPTISLFILPFLAAPIVLTVLKVKKIAENLVMRDYAILGGAAGAVSGLVYLVIFCPLVLLIHLFAKNYYAYGINVLNLFLVIILFISITCIFIITNVAMGLLTGIIVQQFEGKSSS